MLKSEEYNVDFRKIAHCLLIRNILQLPKFKEIIVMIKDTRNHYSNKKRENRYTNEKVKNPKLRTNYDEISGFTCMSKMEYVKINNTNQN